MHYFLSNFKIYFLGILVFSAFCVIDMYTKTQLKVLVRVARLPALYDLNFVQLTYNLTYVWKNNLFFSLLII